MEASIMFLENLISQQLQSLSSLAFHTHLDGAFLASKIVDNKFGAGS